MFRKLAVLAFATVALASAAQQSHVPPLQANPSPAHAAPPAAPLPPVVPVGRPVIGIALEGGGALGLAHIGVLAWLEDHHVPVDRIAGASIGALVGALYATGQSPQQLRALAESNSFGSVFVLQTPYSDLSYRRREDRRQDPAAVVVGLRHGLGIRNAIFSDRGVNAFLATHLFAYDDIGLDYNRLPIPYRCVATDLNTLQTLTFASGPLTQAVRASISIPGVFPPVPDQQGHTLVDGGILDNLPTDVVRQDLHADVVIAVHLANINPRLPVDTSTIVSVLNRAFEAGVARNEDQAAKQASVLISVPLSNFNTMDYSRAAQLIDAGYQAAQQNSAALLPYALSPAGWQAYLADRRSREAPAPGPLRVVRVQGGVRGAQQQVLAAMRPLQGKPLTSPAILSALKPVESNGTYSAGFTTFNPTQPASAASSSSSQDTGVIVRLGHDPVGPPYLLVGGEGEAVTSNVTIVELKTRLIDQNLGGYGSELRADVRFGYLTDVSAEYYRLLTPRGLFVEPRIGLVREPMYVWANQQRVAEQFQQNLVGGAEAGWAISNSAQLAAEWRAQRTDWNVVTGSGGGPNLSGTAQTGVLHIDLNRESSGIVSPQGFHLSAAAGAFFHAVGSVNAPVVMLSAARTFSRTPNNILRAAIDANSYLRANVAQPFRFTLGGPGQLSASSIDEYRGTDTALARISYLHRFAPMPFGLGQGLYGVAGYEAGEVWSPQQSTFLRQDGMAGLVAATPLGALTVGGAAGDAGHRKFFFTLGTVF